MLSPPERFDDDEPIKAPLATAAAALAQPDPELAESGPLSISTRIEYSSLPRGETKDVFGLVTVQAAAANALSSETGEERQAMDLVCVLDVSGSMAGDKIQQVKQAVRFVVDNADPRDRLSIVPFNSAAGRSLPLKRMTVDGKDAANVAALQLNAGGGTCIAAGLDVALSVMEERRQRNKVAAILLLTDGQDGSTRSRLPGLLDRASTAGCAVYAFGFGRDHDAALLGEIAERARTPFTFVEDTSNISEAFAGAVGGLTSVVAQSVELTLDCVVPLKTAHTPFAVHREDRQDRSTRAVVTIPDVFAGERRDILVELAVPATKSSSESEEPLLQASLRYSDLRRGCIVQSPSVAMIALRVDEPQPEVEPDAEVSCQRQRVEVTQALSLATAEGDRGNFEEAQKLLSAAENRLSANSKKTAMTEALNQELVDAKSRMRNHSVWEQGGRAELNDAVQMHRVQRCSMQTSTKTSKAMYLSSTQTSWVKRTK